MNVVVVIPVGPGHRDYAVWAEQSVRKAWRYSHGPFSFMEILVVNDRSGSHGRSWTRNQGLDTPADWHFLMDADDTMRPWAFDCLDPNFDATFGAVCLNRINYRRNVWPVTRETLFEKGADGTLSMGMFVRGNLGLRFNEEMDVGEDFDFYMRLPSFTKVQQSLVSIGYKLPSAGGPRGYVKIDWHSECRKVIERYR